MKYLAILSLALTSSTSGLMAASFLNQTNGVWSTGLNSSGTLLSSGADPHYTLLKLPTGCLATNANCQEALSDQFGPNAYVVIGNDPVGSPWAGNTSTSKWIGPRADQATAFVGGTTPTTAEIYGNDTDFYTYRMVFNLSALGLNPATAVIQLTWWADDSNTFVQGNNSHIRMCAISAATDPTCASSAAVAGSNVAGATGPGTNVTINSGFGSGLYALDFIVFNANWTTSGFDNPSGLQVNITSATADPLDGIPEPATLGLVGVSLLGAAIYTRRKR